MLGSVRVVSKERLAALKNKNEGADVNDPDAVSRRKEAGLEWMTSAPPNRPVRIPEAPSVVEETKPRSNPKELNPYYKDGGEGYPSDDERKETRMPGGVGDGGASWRLKALKRAQEQAAREGKKLDEVVTDRFGSLSSLTAGLASRRAAHANAHLHAIRDRKRNLESQVDTERPEPAADKVEDGSRASYRRQMKTPRVDESLKWKSRRTNERMRPDDAAVLKSAAAACNKYENDGNFMKKFMEEQARKKALESSSEKSRKRNTEIQEPQSSNATADHSDITEAAGKDPNQLAAKAMKLRLMGKVEEAEKLMKEVETLSKSTDTTEETGKKIGASETWLRKITAKQKRDSEHQDFDAVLATKIGRARDGLRPDDEYDDVGAETDRQRRKSASKESQRSRNATTSQFNKLRTQQERCQFCFENPSRAKHLTVAIANFTYLMIPPTAPLVPGHCYILPMQHEGSSRNVDDDVWEELRNFKKCLIKMFKAEEQEVIFIETVFGLSQQRRHCLVECIPVPSGAMKQAPLYFKKAIDEAEDEWSQHNSKKLIDTSVKGLRSSIPKNFPYFHVEFGLHGGYCHVIDDEDSFKPDFGRNVLIGLLKLPQEKMHQKARRYESMEEQRKVVEEFSQQWKPHDWTKMLD